MRIILAKIRFNQGLEPGEFIVDVLTNLPRVFVTYVPRALLECAAENLGCRCHCEFKCMHSRLDKTPAAELLDLFILDETIDGVLCHCEALGSLTPSFFKFLLLFAVIVALIYDPCNLNVKVIDEEDVRLEVRLHIGFPPLGNTVVVGVLLAENEVGLEFLEVMPAGH